MENNYNTIGLIFLLMGITEDYTIYKEKDIKEFIKRLKEEFDLNYKNQFPNEVPDMDLITKIIANEVNSNSQNKDLCKCGELKYKESKLCRKCHIKNKRGQISRTFSRQKKNEKW